MFSRVITVDKPQWAMVTKCQNNQVIFSTGNTCLFLFPQPCFTGTHDSLGAVCHLEFCQNNGTNHPCMGCVRAPYCVGFCRHDRLRVPSQHRRSRLARICPAAIAKRLFVLRVALFFMCLILLQGFDIQFPL